jgi:hypothetical protein
MTSHTPSGRRLSDMKEGDMESAASYSESARARVVMAYEACELSDLARAVVPVGEHELDRDGTICSPGAALIDAVQVLTAARRFLEAAVVFERVGGAGWQTIGGTLGMTAHAARERFETPETRFRQELRSPVSKDLTSSTGDLTWWRAHMIGEPLEAALDLDDWVLRHHDGDGVPEVAPVSGCLITTVGSDLPEGDGPGRFSGDRPLRRC